MTYNGCSMIEMSTMSFGRINTGEECLRLCCESVNDRPAVSYGSTPQETVVNFVKMRDALIAESKRFACNDSCGTRKYTAGCAECSHFQPGDWDGDGRVHYISIGMTPAPCQCKCFYCDLHAGEYGRFNKAEHGEQYEQLFGAIDYALETGLIAPTAVWQISTGEITIHPYKDRIYKLVEKNRVSFFTNCFIFDEKIAQNLSENPHSAINLSIDSGTPETWFKVKGVNNFDKVAENLARYYSASAQDGQITLKYNVLPGVNDNLQDYKSVIEIMKILHVRHLTISRDVRIKYNANDEQLENLIGASGYLLAMLTRNNMTADMFNLTPEERKKAIAFATELLQVGEV